MEWTYFSKKWVCNKIQEKRFPIRKQEVILIVFGAYLISLHDRPKNDAFKGRLQSRKSIREFRKSSSQECGTCLQKVAGLEWKYSDSHFVANCNALKWFDFIWTIDDFWELSKFDWAIDPNFHVRVGRHGHYNFCIKLKSWSKILWPW